MWLPLLLYCSSIFTTTAFIPSYKSYRTSSWKICSTSSSLEEELRETQRQLKHQQQQIQQLIQSIAPKVMIFIDGTWLYYSLFERELSLCPIKRNFGPAWPKTYQVDWEKLPQILSQQVGMSNVVDIFCFTSFKAETSKRSYRYQMFQEMKKAQYTVQMLETIGPNEKCVDISLAVEMLHQASMEKFDIALILTGDKDFLPAISRTRQHRKVGLVSMKMGCNRALYDDTLDYDVIWLDDLLGDILVPRDANYEEPDLVISLYTLFRLLLDFVEASPQGRVTSRDLGRYYQFLRMGPNSVLSQLKLSYGSLKSFLVMLGDDVVQIQERLDSTDPTDKAFWICLSNAQEKIEEFKESTQLTDMENEFWDCYSTSILEDKEKVYHHSMQVGGILNEESNFEDLKVSELKELCRHYELPVSGTKAILTERLEEYRQKCVYPNLIRRAQDIDAPQEFLTEVVTEYLTASHGSTSARNLGRYLASHKSSTGQDTALGELKDWFGGLRTFILQCPEFHVIEETAGRDYIIGFSK